MTARGGVSSDKLNFSKKVASSLQSGGTPEIVANVRCRRGVHEESLEQKRDYVLEHQADILVMGDDWSGKFDFLNDICQVVYLPRTPSVSTTRSSSTRRNSECSRSSVEIAARTEEEEQAFFLCADDEAAAQRMREQPQEEVAAHRSDEDRWARAEHATSGCQR